MEYTKIILNEDALIRTFCSRSSPTSLPAVQARSPLTLILSLLSPIPFVLLELVLLTHTHVYQLFLSLAFTPSALHNKANITMAPSEYFVWAINCLTE